MILPNRFHLACALSILISAPCLSQTIKECGTRKPLRPLIVQADMNRMQQVDPLQLDIFVTIFANNSGTSLAAEEAEVLVQLEHMRSFYAPHNICFNYVGYREVWSTDLNDHNADTEESELNPFMMPNAMNIFIHNNLFNNDGGLNGIAYGIPNTYLSVSGSAIKSTTNISTTAHEMGHCLGLYHTFETVNGEERVKRIGPCANCSNVGDLLCDTEADPHSDDYDTGDDIDVDCNYTGTVTDGCGDLYVMDPHNIMAYGRRLCRNIFTQGQGTRMHAVIAITPGLINCQTPASISFNPNTNQVISSGWAVYSASTSINVRGNTFTINGSALGHFSGSNVIIKPKVHFVPGSGSVQVVAGGILCE